MATAPRKKVLVSGCFDLLHSGHIRFFEEASQLGDLYVRIGTDKNIEMLKHHKTMFPEQERLYMVRGIKYVYDAQFAMGTGDLDWVPDMDALRADYFFVNDDGDRKAKRDAVATRDFCTYFVAKRVPQKNLKRRSSTAIKASLVKKKTKDNKPKPKPISDPISNPKPKPISKPNATNITNIANSVDIDQFKTLVTSKLLDIKRGVIAQQKKLQQMQDDMKKNDDDIKSINQFKTLVTTKLLDIKQDVIAQQKKTQLTKLQATKPVKVVKPVAAVPIVSKKKDFPWRLCLAGGWLDQPWVSSVVRGGVIVMNVSHNSKFCDRAGLGTSSRKTGLKLWKNGRVPSHLSNTDAAQLLFGAENPPGTKYVSGSQDHLGLLLPGINRLDYNGSYWPNYISNMKQQAKQRNKNIREIYQWIERVLWLLPITERATNYDPLIKKNLTENNVEKLADASEKVWKAILNQDTDEFGEGLTETLKAWKLILPNTVPSEFDSIWKKYDRENYGCLFSGCGGGFLMIVSDKQPNKDAFQIKVNDSAWWREQ